MLLQGHVHIISDLEQFTALLVTLNAIVVLFLTFSCAEGVD